MPPESTPMMQQYLKIKKENPDAILFFRLGDFYEMFNEDAVLASQELDLTLTSRDRTKPEEERTPMCGVPYHSCDGYIARLIAKGYKVAICEQMEDPAAAKGIVKRDIIRVVTPGTVDASMLEGNQANYICGIYITGESAGLCFCDVTTGKTHATAFSGPERVNHVINELGRFSPAEALLNDGAWAHKELLALLKDKFNCRVELGGEKRFRPEDARRAVENQYGQEAAVRLPQGDPSALLALGENLQRQDLTLWEGAAALRQLIDRHHLSQEEAAQRVGKSQSAVANKLRLLKLPEDVIATLRSHRLTERHARSLLRLDSPEAQRAALEEILKRGLNVAQTEAYIDRLLQSGTAPRKAAPVYRIRDVRLFLNSVDRSMENIRRAGVDARCDKQESEDEITITIQIPKRRAPRRAVPETELKNL